MNNENNEKCAICGYSAHTTEEHKEERRRAYSMSFLMLALAILNIELGFFVDGGLSPLSFIVGGIALWQASYYFISYKLNIRFKERELGYIRGREQ